MDELHLKENCDENDKEEKVDDGAAFAVTKGTPDVHVPALPQFHHMSVENTCKETKDAINDVEISL